MVGMAAEQLAGLVRAVARPQNLRFVLKKKSPFVTRKKQNYLFISEKRNVKLNKHEKKLMEQISCTKIKNLIISGQGELGN